MAYCLIQSLAKKLAEKIDNGDIDVYKLYEGTSKERHEAFKFLGEENATKVNALFESKLLLKNQQKAMESWIAQVGGVKPEVKNDMFAKVKRLEKVLDPTDLQSFKEDLIRQRLGVGLTMEEAQSLANISKELNREGNTAIERGAARVEMNKVMNEIKLNANKERFRDYLNPLKVFSRISQVSGISKALKASLDNSFFGRQGIKALFTNPIIWGKNFGKSFPDIIKTIFGKADAGFINKLTNEGVGQKVMDAIDTEIYSRKNYENGLMKKAKLDVFGGEEAYPSSIPERIPVLGRLFKASEVAYNGAAKRLRADIFDKMITIAEKQSVDLNNKTNIEGIGKLVNSLTGRGSLGVLEPAGKAINNVFFSAKFAKANYDILTAHLTDPKMGKFARKQAAFNLAKIIIGTAGIMAIANSLWPGSVETDTKSSDFGTIRIGDTRFDISGGIKSLVVLASRVIHAKSTSSTTGKTTELGTGSGQTAPFDLIWDFGENKFSPVMSLLKDLANRTDFEGKKITALGETKNVLVPLPITNFEEVSKNPRAANAILTLILDGLGISSNTYSKKKKK